MKAPKLENQVEKKMENEMDVRCCRAYRGVNNYQDQVLRSWYRVPQIDRNMMLTIV